MNAPSEAGFFRAWLEDMELARQWELESCHAQDWPAAHQFWLLKQNAGDHAAQIIVATSKCPTSQQAARKVVEGISLFLMGYRRQADQAVGISHLIDGGAALHQAVKLSSVWFVQIPTTIH